MTDSGQPFELLAVDLDGTLLDSNHQLPPRNRAALHRAHEAGVRVVLCTGRSFTETRPILADIGLDLDATVTVCGALLSDARSGRTLERVTIDLDRAGRVNDWLRRRGFAVMWLNDPEQAGFDGYVIDGERRHPAIDRWVRRTPCRVERVARLPDDARPPMRVSIIDDLDVLAPLSVELREAFDGDITHNLLPVPAYDLTIVEAFAQQVNKWYGVARLCARWGIDPARTIAVGDDVNDMDMVRSAGLGVAMANAHADVKAVARRVTADNDSCGVALLVDELLDGGAAPC